MAWDDWQDEIDAGYFEPDTAQYLFDDLGIESPGDIDSLHARYDGESWTVEIGAGDWEWSTDFGETLPEWWWQDLYDWSEDHPEIDWELDYEEGTAK